MRDLLTEKLSNYAPPRQLALDYPEAGILVPVTDDENNPEMIFTLRSANLKTIVARCLIRAQAGSRRFVACGHCVERDP